MSSMTIHADAPQQIFRGAHVPRVLAIAPPRSRTFLERGVSNPKQISAAAPKSAREARALPRI